MDTPFGDSPQDLNGLTVVDGEGHKVGSVQRVYKDDVSGAPEWVTVRTGLFGTKETFVPLADAHREEDNLRVPYSKERIKDAPRVDAESHLDAAEEKDLYRYYGRGRPSSAEGGGRDTETQSSGERGGTGGAPLAGAGAGAGGMAMSSRSREGGRGMEEKATEEESRSSKGVGSDSPQETGARGAWNARGDMNREGGRPAMADREMTLHEERMDVNTEEYESGQARLRKRVVTEETSRTVPLSHDEVRMTREKISEEDRSRMSGGETPNFEDGEVEITLHEERPVVRKEAVPVERIRLETERVTEQREISTELRKEEADFDDGNAERSGRSGKGRTSRGKGTRPSGGAAGPAKGTDTERPDTGGKGL